MATNAKHCHYLLEKFTILTEGKCISWEIEQGKVDTVSRMPWVAQCINNNDNRLFRQLIKLGASRDEDSHATRASFLKAHFLILYHSPPKKGGEGEVYYALKQIQSGSYE